MSASKLLGPAPKAITVTIEHSDPELQQEILVTKEDGREQRIVFRCRTNGEPGQCLLDGKEIRGSPRWRGDELVIEIWSQEGAHELYLCDCWSLSTDGQTLTMQHRNDALAGQVAVLHRMN